MRGSCCTGHRTRGIRGPIETTRRPALGLHLVHVTERVEFAAPLRPSEGPGLMGFFQTVTERVEFAAPLRHDHVGTHLVRGPDVTERVEFAAPLRPVQLLGDIQVEVGSQSAWNSRPH